MKGCILTHKKPVRGFPDCLFLKFYLPGHWPLIIAISIIYNKPRSLDSSKFELDRRIAIGFLWHASRRLRLVFVQACSSVFTTLRQKECKIRSSKAAVDLAQLTIQFVQTWASCGLTNCNRKAVHLQSVPSEGMKHSINGVKLFTSCSIETCNRNHNCFQIECLTLVT